MKSLWAIEYKLSETHHSIVYDWDKGEPALYEFKGTAKANFDKIYKHYKDSKPRFYKKNFIIKEYVEKVVE